MVISADLHEKCIFYRKWYKKYWPLKKKSCEFLHGNWWANSYPSKYLSQGAVKTFLNVCNLQGWGKQNTKKFESELYINIDETKWKRLHWKYIIEYFSCCAIYYH